MSALVGTLVGSIEVICGSMFSGKTEELLRRLRRAQYGRLKTQIFKPALDHRYSEEHVQSHDASRLPSQRVSHSHEILALVEDNTRVVGVDEVQFFDVGIVEVAQKLANRGIQVILAGLDQDYRGQPFGPIPTLLAVAETVTKLSAVCTVCGRPASRSQRLFSQDPSVAGDSKEGVPLTVEAPEGLHESPVHVGAAESYEARCRQCHVPEGEVIPAGSVGRRGAAAALSHLKRLHDVLQQSRSQSHRAVEIIKPSGRSTHVKEGPSTEASLEATPPEGPV